MSSTEIKDTLLCKYITPFIKRFVLRPRANPRFNLNCIKCNGNLSNEWATKDGICKTPSEIQRELNMRRKAEILKYKSNTTNHGQNLTKKQKWAQLVKMKSRGNKTYATQTINYTKPNVNVRALNNELIPITKIKAKGVNCDSIKKPYYNSNVPKSSNPANNILYLNNNVPLTNMFEVRKYNTETSNSNFYFVVQSKSTPTRKIVPPNATELNSDPDVVYTDCIYPDST